MCACFVSIAAITQHKYFRFFYIYLVFYMFYWPPGFLGSTHGTGEHCGLFSGIWGASS